MTEMWKRTVFSTVAALTLLAGAAVSAQNSTTLVLRSGDKISGQLVDLGGVGYTVLVNGSERQIAQDDVAVIDFTGHPMTDADWSSFTGATIVVLRNGDTVNGSLYDISGTASLKLTIRTSDGEREMAATDVARIIMARPEPTPPSRTQR